MSEVIKFPVATELPIDVETDPLVGPYRVMIGSYQIISREIACAVKDSDFVGIDIHPGRNGWYVIKLHSAECTTVLDGYGMLVDGDVVIVDCQ